MQAKKPGRAPWAEASKRNTSVQADVRQALSEPIVKMAVDAFIKNAGSSFGPLWGEAKQRLSLTEAGPT